MAPNSEEEGPRLTSVKDGVWSSHDDSNSKVSEAGARNREAGAGAGALPVTDSSHTMPKF